MFTVVQVLICGELRGPRNHDPSFSLDRLCRTTRPVGLLKARSLLDQLHSACKMVAIAGASHTL